ncbi:MAG: DsbC family protein [Burkholderiales bacterium]|nr:DsbC family protein [Burkholderiales bacterium]
MIRLAHAVLGLFVSLAAAANEQAIRQALEPKLGGARIESVQPTPLPGIFEVRYPGRDGPQLLYTDAQGHYAFDGNLYDLRANRNLTEERLRKLTAINFATLPLDLAVKVQRGNGRRVLAVFSDPYCPACQQFERALAEISDITIYYFMYPVIRPDLADHSRAVWCAPDRGKAWLDLALRRKPSAFATNCDAPIDRVIELGRSLRINSTPTLILANGERIRGGLPAAQLREMLDAAAKEGARPGR